MAVKKIQEFPKAVTIDQLKEQQDLDQTSGTGEFNVIEKDYIGQPKDGITFAQQPQHVPTLGAVLAELHEDEASLSTDPKALENMSTNIVIESNVLLTQDQETRVENAAAIAATLSNQKGMNIAKIDYMSRKQLQEIADAMRDIPTPDAVTFADNRKVIIPSEVRDVPNALAKKKSMKLLEAICGTATTAQVVLTARTGGVCFFQKPAMWLAQRLDYELSRRDIWDKVTDIPDFDITRDEQDQTVVKQALAKLFSWHVVEKIEIMSRIRRISLIHAANIMVERVLATAIEEKKPKDYAEQYDDTQTLEQLVANA